MRKPCRSASNDRQVRPFALRELLRQLDLGAELDAKTFVMWRGREGAEYDFAMDARAARETWTPSLLQIPDLYLPHECGLRSPSRRPRRAISFVEKNDD